MPIGAGGGGAGLGDVGGGVGAAIGGIAVLLGAAGKGGKDQYKEAVRLWRKISDPEFDFRELSAPELAVVAQYFPEIYEAKVPDEAKLPEDSPELRAAQLQSIEHLRAVQREGLPLPERLAAQEQQRFMATETQRQQANILRSLAERGRLGGGTEAALRAQAQQQGAELASRQGSDLAQMAVLNRLAASKDLGQLAGQVRGQDIGVSQSRADAVNRFNEFVASMRTRAAADAAASRERAQVANALSRQRVADVNSLARYQTELENLNRKNALRQQLFGAQITRTTGLTQALQDLGMVNYAEQAAKAKTIQNIGAGVGQAAGGGLGFL